MTYATDRLEEALLFLESAESTDDTEERMSCIQQSIKLIEIALLELETHESKPELRSASSATCCKAKAKPAAAKKRKAKAKKTAHTEH